MSARAAAVRWSVLAGFAGLLVAGRAQAQTAPCATDLDCPGTACGSEVCVKSSGLSMCYPANTQGASGTNDGWCSDVGGTPVNSNCKCASLGATCEGFYCSFTVPPGGGTGGGGGGGSTGTGGTGTGTGGSGTGTAGTGGGGDGGCSVAGAPSYGWGAGVMLLAAALLRRRLRHRT